MNANALHVAGFILGRLETAFPAIWKGSKLNVPLYPGPLPQELALFNQRSLYKVPLGAQRALLGWAAQEWPLVLLDYVPGPGEVLKLQAKGMRPVTLIEAGEMQDRDIFSGKNPLQFVLHDLSHADCYFGRPDWQRGQLGLYRLFEKAHSDGFFRAPFQQDKIFKEQMEYALSDMNAHAVHLMKYIKGIWIEHSLRLQGQDRHERMNPAARSYLEGMIQDFSTTTLWPKQAAQAFAAINNDDEAPHLEFMQNYLEAIPTALT